MRKKNIYILIILALFFIPVTKGQENPEASYDSRINEIKKELKLETNDSEKIELMRQLCVNYKFHRPDSALYYGNQAFALMKKSGDYSKQINIMNNMILTYTGLGNNTKALEMTLNALKLAEQTGHKTQIPNMLNHLGRFYRSSQMYDEALQCFFESKSIYDSLNNTTFSMMQDVNIGTTYLSLKNIDSASYYFETAYQKSLQNKQTWQRIIALNGKVLYYRSINDIEQALYYNRQFLNLASTSGNFFNGNFNMADLYFETGQIDSSLYYAQIAFDIAKESGFFSNIISSSELLAKLYDEIDITQANEYYKKTLLWKDSLNAMSNAAAFSSIIESDQEVRQFEIEKTRTEFQNRLRRNAFLGSIFTLIIIAFFLFLLNRRKQKAKQKIESAYHQLKSTQTQLIHSEKMASLGELTAGIAHEIQNPLNFVNNFSEVNSELIDEAKEENDKGNRAEVKNILKDIQENEQKINHHGKRADAIVKGMLQHSRSSSGKKEPTDINALADEYLRLAYHGLRAKDKSFNADFKTEFDESLPKINVIPQDIGRVLLNLINNAFYAAPLPPEGGFKDPNYMHKPMVMVKTSSIIPPSGGMRGACLISVSDNGPGIPQNIVDKIFQPFFTTKPTGSGTGLGLSLSYDIIKAHGGELKVETKEGEGSEFIIKIPTS